jgi:transcriptional regulator with XRE-family HTH domain
MMFDYYHPKAIRAARKKLGWSQEKLSIKSEYSRSTIYKTESQTRPINTPVINYLAKDLNAAGATVLPVPVVRRPFVHHVDIPQHYCEYQPEPEPKTRCNARTRNSKPCLSWPIAGKKRCKLHGGMSTGPRTETGRAAISKAQKQRWQSYRKVGSTTSQSFSS